MIGLRSGWIALLVVGHAMTGWGQTNVIFSRITSTAVRSFHTNLFVNTGECRGFTKRLDPMVPRVPANQHDAARDYIYNQVRGMGLPVRLDPFTFWTSFGKAGATYQYSGCNNIKVVIPGVEPAAYGIYVVGAFYDTIDRGQPLPTNLDWGPAPKSPGADLNASGVAAVMTVAQAIANQRFMATIVLVFFDASEKNFGGSYHFVRKWITTNPARTNRLYQPSIRGMISIDCVGYNPADWTHNSVALWGGAQDPTRLRKKLAKELTGCGGIRVAQAGSILSSDHVPFWEAGIDACVLSERNIWNNPYIYTPSDSIAKAGYIDYAYTANIVKGVAGFLIKQAVLAQRLTVTTAGDGQVAGGGSGYFRSGSRVVLEAVPSPGWRLSGWTGDIGQCEALDRMLIVPMTQDRAIQAHFIPN